MKRLFGKTQKSYTNEIEIDMSSVQSFGIEDFRHSLDDSRANIDKIYLINKKLMLLSIPIQGYYRFKVSSLTIQNVLVKMIPKSSIASIAEPR
jgi:hypothetical protein